MDVKKSILRSLNHRFQVFSKVDWKLSCVSIYGRQEMKQKALRELEKQMSDLLPKCNIINLIGDDKPRGLASVVIKRYGIHLKKLLQSSRAEVIQFHRNKKTLMVIGEKESYAKVLNEIDLCCKLLDASNEKSSHDILANECVACFCQVDDDGYRLQYCGHLYCRDCIIQQLNCAITSSFPLNCADCNQEFVVQDLERLLMKSPQPRLFDILLTEFVRRHPNQWRYCSTPECDSVYKKSPGDEIFTCSTCQKKTCRLCDTEYHAGYDCDEIKLIRENADLPIEAFLRDNAHKVKKCPTCSAAIEKNEGCQHMQCRFCHTHFCWLCLIGFRTSEECYAHLQKSHGGYM